MKTKKERLISWRDYRPTIIEKICFSLGLHFLNRVESLIIWHFILELLIICLVPNFQEANLNLVDFHLTNPSLTKYLKLFEHTLLCIFELKLAF